MFRGGGLGNDLTARRLLLYGRPTAPQAVIVFYMILQQTYWLKALTQSWISAQKKLLLTYCVKILPTGRCLLSPQYGKALSASFRPFTTRLCPEKIEPPEVIIIAFRVQPFHWCCSLLFVLVLFYFT